MIDIDEKKRNQLIAQMMGISQNGKAEVANLLQKNRFNPDRVPAENAGILYMNGELIGSRGNIISITGKAKSRKTVIATSMASACISGREILGIEANLTPDDIIVHIDTEQGYSDYYHTTKRIYNQAGFQIPPNNFISFHERGFSASQRLESLEVLFKEFNPSVCIVDGTRDLLSDFNSNEETDQVMSALLRLSLEYNALIVNVVHVTKSHGYMRGALGTALEDKSETVILVEKEADNPDISTVKPQYSRHKDFEPFAISFNDGLGFYEIDQEWEQELGNKPRGRKKGVQFTDMPIDAHKQIVSNAFGANISLGYSKLVDGLKSQYGIGVNRTKDFIKLLLDQGIIVKDGKTYHQTV